MEITLQPGDSAEEFPLSGGGEDDVWFLLFVGAGLLGGLTFFFWVWLFQILLFFGGGGRGEEDFLGV